MQLFRLPAAALILAVGLAATAARADDSVEVGSFKNDWTGNSLVVEAIADPKVKGVTCHLVHFSRSLIDRLTKGNMFEDPSDASIACRQTGPIVVGDIDTSKSGEDVFSVRASLIFKSIAIKRIYDKLDDTLIYVSYSKQVKNASAKMGITTVPLGPAGATWTGRKPG